MSETRKKVPTVDIPDPRRLQEHGVTIDAPAPTSAIVDPWQITRGGELPRPASQNGAGQAPSESNES